MTDKERPDVYTTRTLAQAAGLTSDYIRQLILAGKIKAEKVGRDWVISAREALRFLRERE